MPPYVPGKPLSVLDAFFSVYLGCDIGQMAPGETRVVASARRERAELRYTEPFAMWMIVAQSRCVISVRGELMRRVARIVRPLGIERMRDPQATQRLCLKSSCQTSVSASDKTVSAPVGHSRAQRPQPVHLEPSNVTLPRGEASFSNPRRLSPSR